MTKLHAVIFAAVSVLAFLALPVQSQQSDTVELLEFTVVGRSDTDGPRPVLLALPPGNQNQQMVKFGEQAYWKNEAERLGWTVISPVAPTGQSLRGPNISKVLELVDYVEKTYELENNRVHVAGVSNGGRTALELALTQPERFASLNLLPGMQEGIDTSQLKRIALLPIALYVGGNDTNWLVPMQAMADELTKLGHPPAVFRIFAGEGHTPRSLTGNILFQALQSFR